MGLDKSGLKARALLWGTAVLGIKSNPELHQEAGQQLSAITWHGGCILELPLHSPLPSQSSLDIARAADAPRSSSGISVWHEGDAVTLFS